MIGMSVYKWNIDIAFSKIIAFSLVFLLAGCVAKKSGIESNTHLSDALTSENMVPTFPEEYYIEQGLKYFLTMESSVSIKVKPHYSKRVVRWEWHPWLLLTGYGKRNLIITDILLKLNPTKYDTIDCQYFARQPFCRCHVVFDYGGKKIPIYEEFTFNDQGEITFIEAWSDFPSLLPMDKEDYWAEGDNVERLSTRVPGLGNKTGLINPSAIWTLEAARNDPDLADLFYRIRNPYNSWLKELLKQRKEMEKADTPPEGDAYPYHSIQKSQ